MSYWNISLANFFKELLLGPGLFVFLILLGVLLLLFSSRRWIVAFYFFGLSLAFALYASDWPARVIGDRLQAEVEREAASPELRDCAREWSVLVVLGAGFAGATSPSSSGAARLEKAVEVLRASNVIAPTVIVSGGRTDARFPASEGGVGVNYLKHTGEFANLIAEDESLNTHQNAVLTKALIERLGLSKKIILVSTMMHLPRASAAFRKQGFEVCPVGVAERHPVNSISFANAIETYGILNELFGYLGYWAKNWV